MPWRRSCRGRCPDAVGELSASSRYASSEDGVPSSLSARTRARAPPGSPGRDPSSAHRGTARAAGGPARGRGPGAALAACVRAEAPVRGLDQLRTLKQLVGTGASLRAAQAVERALQSQQLGARHRGSSSASCRRRRSRGGQLGPRRDVAPEDQPRPPRPGHVVSIRSSSTSQPRSARGSRRSRPRRRADRTPSRAPRAARRGTCAPSWLATIAPAGGAAAPEVRPPASTTHPTQVRTPSRRGGRCRRAARTPAPSARQRELRRGVAGRVADRQRAGVARGEKPERRVPGCAAARRSARRPRVVHAAAATETTSQARRRAPAARQDAAGRCDRRAQSRARPAIVDRYHRQGAALPAAPDRTCRCGSRTGTRRRSRRRARAPFHVKPPETSRVGRGAHGGAPPRSAPDEAECAAAGPAVGPRVGVREQVGALFERQPPGVEDVDLPRKQLWVA